MDELVEEEEQVLEGDELSGGNGRLEEEADVIQLDDWCPCWMERQWMAAHTR